MYIQYFVWKHDTIQESLQMFLPVHSAINDFQILSWNHLDAESHLNRLLLYQMFLAKVVSDMGCNQNLSSQLIYLSVHFSTMNSSPHLNERLKNSAYLSLASLSATYFCLHVLYDPLRTYSFHSFLARSHDHSFQFEIGTDGVMGIVMDEWQIGHSFYQNIPFYWK